MGHKGKGKGKYNRRRGNAGIIYISIITVLLLMWVFHWKILDIFVYRYGVCTTARISEQIRATRHGIDTYYYKFTLEGKTYKGISYYEEGADKDKIGMALSIVYIPRFPSINRPINEYFDGNFECPTP